MNSFRRHLRLWLPALVTVVTLLLATTAHADFEQVGLFGQSGNGEQLEYSDGIAVNTTGAGGVEAGSVYVAAGERISRYSPTGEFKEAWGYSTIKSGPDLPDAVQSLTVTAISGAYTLSAATAVGEGQFTKGSNVVTGVTTRFGAFRVGDTISVFESVPPGTTIVAVGSGTLELSAPSADSVSHSIEATETTAPIQAGASAAEVKETLIALPAFATGDLSLTGGPGDATGSAPYDATFEGAYVGSRRFPRLSATDVSLTGGSPASSVAVATLVNPNAPRYERCRPANGDTCNPQNGIGSFHGEAAGYFNEPTGVAVDQSNGYVYLLNGLTPGYRVHDLIEVFSADGSESIARFGDAETEGKTVESDPEKLHAEDTGIVVANDGEVYIADPAELEPRIMCFRPENGDYEHYVYCGRSQDIKLNQTGEQLSFDDAGHIYVANQESIQELSLATPTAPALCTYNTNGQSYAMTTNPVTGEVFYFLSTNSKSGVYRLKPCNPEKGKFEEAQARIVGSPPVVKIRALTFNPASVWGTNRPRGILYGADAEPHNSETPTYRGLGYIFAPAEVHSPTVESESVSSTRTGSTVLHAEINPHGFGTHYVFQYLTEAQYEANRPEERFAGAVEAPVGGGEVAGNVVGQPAVSISGLMPDTAYRFRVVATSKCNVETGEPCVSQGEAFALITYPLYAPGLPDHRAYELVSPAQKHGGEVIPAAPEIASSCPDNCKPNSLGYIFPMQSSPDGEAVSYVGQPFTLFEGAVNYDSYVSRRTISGWQTTALIPALPVNKVRQNAFDSSLEQGLLSVEASGSEPAGLEFQATSAPGSTTSLLTGAPPDRSANEFHIAYGGDSVDFSRIFFAANDTLTESTPFAPKPPDPGASKSDLYEWHAGKLVLVDVLPGNTTVATGGGFASTSPDAHAVSQDGSRVFFTGQAGELYVREDGEVTREVRHAGTFLTASADGLEVLLSDGCLYSLLTEACTDLTEGQKGFQGVAGSGEEGGRISHVYFVDTAVLPAAESNERGQSAQAGEDNLYSWSQGGPNFIATLTASDSAGTGSGFNDWVTKSGARTAEASRNGRFLAFASTAPLTGYENVGPCSKVTNPKNEPEIVEGPCQEAFLYDSATRKLSCASCDPTGEPPLGDSTLRLIKGAPETLPQPRYLTDEGRLYFDSADSLNSRDTNDGVEDVYEFEPQGAGREGTCRREAGCIFLISAGTGTADSNLIAVDENGANVFFDTRDQLTLKDKDELLDVYDAREGGGIPGETEVARAECQGDSCQAVVSLPSYQTPGSFSFAGAGNALVPSVPFVPPVSSKAKAKSLTRAQKLAQALKSCHKDKSRFRRVSCEKQARKRFGPKPTVKVKRKGGK